jgi:uncharacterized protein (TIGR02145 family)
MKKNRFFFSGEHTLILVFICGGLMLLFLNRCKKDTVNAPSLTTAKVTNIAISTATSGGNITSNGGDMIIARGVCWSTNQMPTVNDNKTTDSTGVGSFTSNITGLTQATEYYVRAYATNGAGTAYGRQVSFTTLTTGLGDILFNPNVAYGSVTDIDGNTYRTVQIGTQTWMAENLKTTRFNNGDLIGTTSPATLDLSNEQNPIYQWAYDGKEEYVKNYGRLYTWCAIADSLSVCPTGWHVGSGDDWSTLLDYLGGDSIAMLKLREIGTTHWENSLLNNANETGFTALPGGYRNEFGEFLGIGAVGKWFGGCVCWEVEMDTSHLNRFFPMTGMGPCPGRTYNYSWNYGKSVRCVKDSK